MLFCNLHLTKTTDFPRFSAIFDVKWGRISTEEILNITWRVGQLSTEYRPTLQGGFANSACFGRFFSTLKNDTLLGEASHTVAFCQLRKVAICTIPQREVGLPFRFGFPFSTNEEEFVRWADIYIAKTNARKKFLCKKTKYIIRIRAVNGLIPGQFSSYKTAKTGKKNFKYKKFCFIDSWLNNLFVFILVFLNVYWS